MNTHFFSTILSDVWTNYISKPIAVVSIFILCMLCTQQLNAQCLSVVNPTAGGFSQYTANIGVNCQISIKPSDLATVNLSGTCTAPSAADKFSLDIFNTAATSVDYNVETALPFSGASTFNLSAVPSSALIGQTRFVKVTYWKATGATFSNVGTALGFVTFKDTAAPTFVCPSDITIECYDDTSSVFTGNVTGLADCSGTSALKVSHSTALSGVNFCTDPNFVIYKRTFNVADAANNVGTCMQTIYIKKGVLADVTFPSNLELATANPVCNYTDLRPNTIGSTAKYKTTNVPFALPNPFQKDYCNLIIVFSDAAPTTTCGIGTSRVRTWSVTDLCASGAAATVKSTQTITIVDKEKPVLQNVNGGNPLVFPTSNGTNCTASVMLPPIVASDCSALTYKITGPNGLCINANGSIAPTVLTAAATPYLFTYTVTDACGNVSDKVANVVVQDNTAPVAVCQQGVNISLSNYGDATRYAVLFNENSTDGCGISGYKVRRVLPAGQSFADFVSFNCTDIGKPNIMVELQVTDAFNNVNTCMSSVNVFDKLGPSVTPPANVTIECTANLSNLNVYGTPSIYDNCGFNPGQPVYTEDKSNISNCGTGFITRTWTATDKQGFTSSGSQKITIINSNPFNPNPAIVGNPDKITWPQNMSVLSSVVGCKTPAYFSVALGGEPTYTTSNSCNLIAKSYTDDVFQVNPNAGCFKIMRKWKVIDWCQNMANPLAGVWEYTQILTMMDNVPPYFGPGADPVDLTFSTSGTSCSATVKLTIPKATDDCSGTPVVTLESNLPGFNPSNPTAAFNVPLINKVTGDEYYINYKITDACGNTTLKTTKVFVKDLVKPSPVAMQGFATTVNPSSKNVIIYVANINNGSYDYCTPTPSLTYAFDENFTKTEIIFTCDSLGVRKVKLWVKDLAGNKDFTVTYVDVQNNMGACTGVQMATIAGAIQTEKGDKVENVSVEMTASSSSYIFKPFMTGNNGAFTFANVATNGNYAVTPKKDDDALNGVSTYDLVLMSKHILNQQPLTTPYKLIAADINKNGKITTADMVELRKLILHINANLPNNTSWRFIEKSFNFPNPANPWSTVFPELMNFNNIPQGAQADFVGVKVGDLNGTAQANSTQASSASDRSRRTWYVSADDRSVKQNEDVTLVFNGDTGMEGFQFTMQYDKAALSFVGAAGVDFALLEDGIVTMSSVDNQPFKIMFKALADSRLSKVVQFNSSVIDAEAYNTERNETANLVLAFNNLLPVVNVFELHQNKPNPFRGVTTVSFTLPEDSKAKLTIYDMAGRTVSVVEGDYKKGFNEMTINDLNVTGVLFYRLDTPNNTGTKKMIVLQ